MANFSQWMKQNTQLADSSVYKYAHGAATISREMVQSGVISKPLKDMTPIELDVAVLLILSDEAFLKKNKKGNSMYSNALKQFRAYRKDEEAAVAEASIMDAIGPAPVSETERVELIKARVGQGIFRRKVLARYDHRCILSGIDMPRLLIASHIKPWATSSNTERLQADNGLCLSPAYDRLFDIGLITFTDKGQLRISSQLTRENAERLRLTSGEIYDLKPTPNLLAHMEYHRDMIFIR